MNKIKFIKAEVKNYTDEHQEVECTYTLNGIEFIIKWSNSQKSTGELVAFYLKGSECVESNDPDTYDLIIKILHAILTQSGDLSEKELSIYHSMMDCFNPVDCEELVQKQAA